MISGICAVGTAIDTCIYYCGLTTDWNPKKWKEGVAVNNFIFLLNIICTRFVVEDSTRTYTPLLMTLIYQ